MEKSIDNELPVEELLEEAKNVYFDERSYPPFELNRTHLAKKLWNEKQMKNVLTNILDWLKPYELLLKKQSGRPAEIDVEDARNVTAILVAHLNEINDRQLLFDRPLIRFFVENRFFEVSEKLFALAKELDPLLTHKDIFQAMKHIWIMNSLQLFWGDAVELTAPIYSFGVLYPYEDNFLDSTEVDQKEKDAFNRKLSSFLNGKELIPENVLEEKVAAFFNLVNSSSVYTTSDRLVESVRFIHQAQIKSMEQASSESLSKEDMLSITFLKGGSAVLADGLLVKEVLSTEEMHFAFQIGCFLQLIDDLQDIQSDADEGIQTVFNSKASQKEVDDEVKRLISFIFEVNKEKETDTFEQAYQKKVISYSMLVLIMDAIGQQPESVSPEFYKELEQYSKVRLSFYKKLWNEIGKVMGF